jgi:Kef-type K+ transport system membrane component KefB
MIEIPVHDPVLIFAIVMMMVLIAPIFAKLFKLPGIIGLITAGIIFGPHIIGLLERDRTIELLGTVGLLYIMFQAGLEIDMALVKKNKHYSLIFGLLTFFIPLSIGTLAGYTILDMKLSAAILLASMFSSHTLISFPIVSRLGITKNRSVSSTIGGTIITDTLALIILAVVIGSNQGDLDASFLFQLIIFSTIYTLLVILLLPIISRWFFHRFSTDTGIEDYVFVIAALFICAYLSHLVGLEPIIGAFLAGLTLNSLIPEKSILMNRIQFVGDSLFIPFFLISVGMIVNPKVIITDSLTIIVMATMVIIALSSKWLAAHLFGIIVKFNKSEKNLMYGLSVNQAAATLAAVLVAYRVGIFPESVLTGTILMIIVTCFVGAIVTEKYAKKIIVESDNKSELESKKHSERILVLIHNPNSLNNLMDLAILLHSGEKDEPIYPLNVSMDDHDAETQIMQAENLLTKAMMRAISADKAVVPLSKLDVNLANAIHQTVKEYRISKVVMGWSSSAKLSIHYSGQIMNQFVFKSNQIIFQANILQPMNIAKRVHLILPPFINKQNGFSETLFTVKRFIHSVGAKVTVYAEEDSYNEVKSHIFKQKPTVFGDAHFIVSWKKISAEIRQSIAANDIIIILLSRPGRIAWRLGFERMPAHLVKQFPTYNVISVYPRFHSDDIEDETDYFKKELTLLNSIPESHFLFLKADKSLTDVFTFIAKELYFKNSDELIHLLTTTMNESIIELSADLSLLHVHVDGILAPQIFIAKSQQNFSFQNDEIKSKIVVILLSPLNQPASIHLKILSEIARISQIDNWLQSIITANNYDEFTQLMKQHSDDSADN